MKNRDRKCGYALVTVMSIMAAMAVTFSTLMTMGSQSAYMGTLLKDRTKATAYAEAGIEFAYAILRDDFTKQSTLSAFKVNDTLSTITSNSVVTTYADGQYVLQLIPLGNGFVVISSKGICGISDIEVETLIEDSNFSSLEAWDMAVFAGGEGQSKISGGGFVDSDGNLQFVYTNGDMALNGGAAIRAYLRAAGTISGSNLPVAGDTADAQPRVDMPTLESRYNSFAYYEATADATDSGKVQIKNDTIIGGDGILYVDGSVVIKAAFTGTIIATGDIEIQAGGSLTPGPSGIAAATSSGDIRYGTTANSGGLYYAETGDFIQNASIGNLTGQIIVGGIIDKTGGSGITFSGASTAPQDPNVVIAGWQK